MGESTELQYLTPELYEQAEETLKGITYETLFLKLYACGERLEANGHQLAAQEIAKTIREHIATVKSKQLN